MSEQVTQRGKIKEVNLNGDTTEEFAKKMVEKKSLEKKYYHDSFQECLLDMDEEFVFIGDKVYQVLETEFLEYDIFRSHQNPDGTIDFLISYYNGACGRDEAIEKALRN